MVPCFLVSIQQRVKLSTCCRFYLLHRNPHRSVSISRAATLFQYHAQLPQRRRLVWHAGFLQEQEAQELAEEISAKKKSLENLKFHQCMGTKEQLASVQTCQSQLEDLLQKYEQLTGEAYGDKASLSQTEQPAKPTLHQL